MLDFFRKHPLRTGLLLVVAYFIYFVAPGIFAPTSFGRGRGVENAGDMIAQLPSELGLAASVLAVVGIMGWWDQCGFHLRLNKGWLKYFLVPFGFTCLILGAAAAMAYTNQTNIVAVVGFDHLVVLVLMTLLVGVFEETLFRGIVFMGWRQAYGPILAILVSSVMFGCMHFVNWVDGQPLSNTIIQVTHAGFGGFMYAAIRLRVGSILPVMVLHGFWDASVGIMGSIPESLEAQATALPAPQDEQPKRRFD